MPDRSWYRLSNWGLPTLFVAALWLQAAIGSLFDTAAVTAETCPSTLGSPEFVQQNGSMWQVGHMSMCALH